MNELDRDTEAGRALMRKRGINFTAFKKEFFGCLVNGEKCFSGDGLVDLYNDYALVCYMVEKKATGRVVSVTEWAVESYERHTPKNDAFWLIDRLRKKAISEE